VGRSSLAERAAAGVLAVAGTFGGLADDGSDGVSGVEGVVASLIERAIALLPRTRQKT
jgi:hypothetical protein